MIVWVSKYALTSGRTAPACLLLPSRCARRSGRLWSSCTACARLAGR